MKETTCAKCGVKFGMEDALFDKRKEDGREFFCPNGHSLWFGESLVKKLEKQVADLRRRVDDWEEYSKYQGHAINGYKGQIAKLKKKVKALEELSRHTAGVVEEVTNGAYA